MRVDLAVAHALAAACDGVAEGMVERRRPRVVACDVRANELGGRKLEVGGKSKERTLGPNVEALDPGVWWDHVPEGWVIVRIVEEASVCVVVARRSGEEVDKLHQHELGDQRSVGLVNNVANTVR